MATATEVYESLTRDGVVLRVQDGQLKARATQGAMTDAWRHMIRTHRMDLVRFLTSPVTTTSQETAVVLSKDRTDSLAPTTPCACCGGTQRWLDVDVWRCVTCWPTPLTAAACTAEARFQRTRAPRHLPRQERSQ